MITSFKNGNTTYTFKSDGTRIKTTEDDHFELEFPESIDLKITNQCFNNCEFCHEWSNRGGAHGNIDEPFLNSLPPGMEIAIGGGNILLHPEIDNLLEKLKSNGQFANITVHVKDYINSYERIQKWASNGLINGIGISYNRGFFKELTTLPINNNCVVHLIAGLFTGTDLIFLKNLKVDKILILGYKNFGRGEFYYSDKIKESIEDCAKMMPYVLQMFKVVSFDTLATKQLNIQSCVSEDVWNTCYNGEDGTSTMYVDLVERKFAKNSITPLDQRHDLLSSIQEMFKIIQDENNNSQECLGD